MQTQDKYNDSSILIFFEVFQYIEYLLCLLLREYSFYFICRIKSKYNTLLK